jgi:hypothetical protein
VNASLVPTIDAANAEATVDDDKVLIHKRITESLGMAAFNEKVQQFLEAALRRVALKGAVRARGGDKRRFDAVQSKVRGMMG